ncbi:MAG: 3-hydroxyacyl-ACP dehydratase FabZ [Spirochaetia bacterium]
MTDIKSLLPHRDPFLFVDRIEKADAEEVVAYRRFTGAEPFFAGHFPHYPVVPGVLLIETLAQCGGAGVRMASGASGIFFLASVEKAKFRRQVRPGDEVRCVVRTLRSSKSMLRQSGKAFVGEELAAEAEWLCLIGDAPTP